ncbi:MAG: VWA domain-containing protein [Pirellulaceae bacterium]
MFGYEIHLERPWFLLLLLLIPVIWLTAWGGLSAMGRSRWVLAASVRSLLVLLMVLALAEVDIVRRSERTTVMYLVDRSLSIPRDQLEEVIQYAQSTARAQRRQAREDLVGVISFGSEAALETPPYSGDPVLARRFETMIDADNTNLEAALKLAQASFPPDSGKRVVIISDGNETMGDALGQARRLAAEGIGIDVVPIRRTPHAEISVEKIATPVDAWKGSPFDVRVVMRTDPAPGGSDKPVPGRLTVRRLLQGEEQMVAEQEVELTPGKQVFTFREDLGAEGFFTYEARFTPIEADGDGFTQNNQATSFTHIRGPGKVLLIVDWTRADEFDSLVKILQQNKIEVTVQPSNQLFSRFADLQAYDAVILGNVPRAGGDQGQEISVFSDQQVSMLVENTRRMGSGLIMLGGPESFGAGGWTNTPIEEAMPVDFSIKDAKVIPTGALMMVIDRSGSMSGDKLDLCKAAAAEAVKILGPQDYIGVIAFDTHPTRVVPIQKVGNGRAATRMISRISLGGGTDVYPGMEDGYRSLQSIQASAKHMIVLTDGQTPPNDFQGLTQEMRAQGITVSAVGVGADADLNLMQTIASVGGGKFYHVTSPQAVPRIFMREARRVSRPLLFEDPRGFTPQLVSQHEILSGMEGSFPAMTGYVMTSAKDHPLVETPLISPLPANQKSPILATWQYGLGRSVAFTTDTGQRWTNAWTPWEGHEKLFSQMVRWAMRPNNEDAKYMLTSDVDGQKVRVVLTALDEEGDFVNFLAPSLAAVGPKENNLDLDFKQEAPGRYVAEFDAQTPGPYFMAVSPGPNETPLRMGVNVGYSAEFLNREENMNVLTQLAALTPRDGEPGQLVELSGGRALDGDEEVVDLFREGLARAAHQQPAWHWMLLAAACLFVFDIANRRIAWDHYWLPMLWAMLARKKTAEPANPALDRLRARKDAVRQEITQQNSSRRFEEQVPAGTSTSIEELTETTGESRSQKSGKAMSAEDPANQETAYLDRLLAAKRKAKQEPRE